LWDVDKCPPPLGKSGGGSWAVRKIKDFVKSKRLLLVSFTCFLSSLKQTEEMVVLGQELEEVVGVTLTTTPANMNNNNNNTDLCVLGEMMKMIHFHPPPHTLILITDASTNHLTKTLNFLDQIYYRVILIHPGDISNGLRCSLNGTSFLA
jgi:hypothetical protein